MNPHATNLLVLAAASWIVWMALHATWGLFVQWLRRPKPEDPLTKAHAEALVENRQRDAQARLQALGIPSIYDRKPQQDYVVSTHSDIRQRITRAAGKRPSGLKANRQTMRGNS
jgi:hypothetical protein